MIFIKKNHLLDIKLVNEMNSIACRRKEKTSIMFSKKEETLPLELTKQNVRYQTPRMEDL